MTKNKGTNDQPAPSFEEALSKLEQIVHCLEEGDLGLADSVAQYEAGIKLFKQCHGLLECAERKIELLSGFDAAGNPVTRPFDDEASASLQEKGQVRNRRRSASPAGDTNRTSVNADPTSIDITKGLF